MFSVSRDDGTVSDLAECGDALLRFAKYVLDPDIPHARLVGNVGDFRTFERKRRKLRLAAMGGQRLQLPQHSGFIGLDGEAVDFDSQLHAAE